MRDEWESALLITVMTPIVLFCSGVVGLFPGLFIAAFMGSNLSDGAGYGIASGVLVGAVIWIGFIIIERRRG